MGKRFANYRLDASKIRMDSRGFARVPAAFTKAGVVAYRLDGKIVRELRRPETVQASADSLAGAPLTIDHPRDPSHAPIAVDASNVRDLGVGSTGDRFDMEDDLLVGEVVITDPDTIEKVKSGKLTELSTGMFDVEIKREGGVYDGVPYDQEQIRIDHNHVALGPPGWNRNGPDVSLRLDSADAVEIDPENQTEINNMTTRIRLDGRDLEVAESDVEFLQNLATKATQTDKLAAERDALQARLDSAEKDLESAKSVDVEGRVKARISLERSAEKVLGERFDSSLSDDDLKIAVIKSVNGDVPADRLDSPAYVDAAFDFALSSHAKAAESAHKVADKARPRVDSKDAASVDRYAEIYYNGPVDHYAEFHYNGPAKQ